MLTSNYRLVLAAKRRGARSAYVVRPTGWKGSYHRKPPQSEHKCLDRTEMNRLVARLEG